jgi:dTDP-4-dehydrorhamnose 3,5-epimerase
MQIENTFIDGLYVLTPRILRDERGYFYESFSKKVFEDLNINSNFVQDNESFSQKGTIRGLHFQKGNRAQAKLVRCSKGTVYDVAVDLRVGSKTFGKWHGVVLSEENKKQFYIPRGFAHGFSVLSETAILNYKCDNFYDKESDCGIIFNDSLLNIDWRVGQMIISEKDRNLKRLSDLSSDELFILNKSSYPATADESSVSQ